MSTPTPDPYEILGVAKDAQLPEIRSAHRKLVLKCHPDKVQDPTLKAQKQDEFQRVQTAYELLADEKARKRYDDQARLAELREQMRAKTAASASNRPSAAASPSSSRPTPTTTYKYEIHTNDRTYKTSRPPSPIRGYSAYSRSYEDDHPRAADIFEGVRTVRREKSYQDKTPKREDREREKDHERARDKEYVREIRDREKDKERERERRKRADDAIRRAEKEAKEAEKEVRRAEKKSRDKSRKRDTEDKKRHAKPYIETYDGEHVSSKSEKKKSSKKHDERRERDRSTHREEVVPPVTSSMPPPPIPVEYQDEYQDKANAARNYIQAARSKGSHNAARYVQPPAPTPPPVSSPFAAPAADEDDARRSSAKPRRGSSGEKAYKPEVVDDPVEATPPTARPHMHKSATSTGAPTTSPPRRTNTMPNEYSRHVPGISRAQTFSGAYPEDPRGRGRTRMQAQVPESDEEDEYERYRRERKAHRSSKKHRSPENRGGEQVLQYRVDGGRTTLQSSYSRSHEEGYSYYANQPGVRVVERPAMPGRDTSYSAGYANYPGKVKTSSYGDVQFSEYPAYREAYAA
ncbi:Chaperone protein DnaJ [Fusarium austroafricanum]|uniref:Chaperone protein DnaJ n=1 Tax=Fusarium austroafricanum TaxID=2364996 RepID=A0A8H4P245_9HYPO|nr:Chaperone protein DnaJ [Fusarium austroafricanum]